MNEDQNNQPKADTQNENKKVVTTTITCKFCGKTQEVTVEVPEATNTPKMIWND